MKCIVFAAALALAIALPAGFDQLVGERRPVFNKISWQDCAVLAGHCGLVTPGILFCSFKQSGETLTELHALQWHVWELRHSERQCFA